ncbi:chemokine-like receptor 1 [Archocentrus centrarchus]|uniref:chemokine-like receptor 1 n=1 Tax=Archocentrus centrarchus TaxID=63155 RepID=UPI0011EA1497|nr:chemokine-like receptor 1 [Archocentrus centrarchus]
MDEDYIVYDEYTAGNDTNANESNLSKEGLTNFHSPQSTWTHALVAVNIIICVLGLAGNSLVIWICGWKMKTTVITTWYISLAISNFLFCAFLPFEVVYMITSHWPFGEVLCKLASSTLFLNMHSSVFLLVLITADRCIMVLFPVWSHNHRKVGKAFGAVILMWLLSALLTAPSLIYRKTTVHGSVIQCHTERLPAVALARFICGFLIPFLMIVFCCLVLGIKLRNLTLKSTKPYKIMAALILSFFVFWVPYHTFVLLELDFQNYNLKAIQTGLKVGVTLAAANSIISPVLYVFIGNDFKKTLRRSLSSRIEEALAEDIRTGGLNHSRFKSMETVPN